MTARRPRPIDHCVLPVEDLNVANARLSALGFTVAPRADHPFGTANACVYFADNSYLEPLAIVDAELATATSLKRNVFGVRDAAYRFRNGPEGFSALVMGTNNAKSDHRRFVFSGISAGRQLVFSRPFHMPDGSVDEASFRLAFAADPRSPDAFFFTCERTKVPNVDRSKLENHENGVAGISKVIMSEPYPSDFEFLCQELARSRKVTVRDTGIDVQAANGVLCVLDAKGCKKELGLAIGNDRGLRLRAIVFDVPSLEAVKSVLQAGEVGYEFRADRIVVQPAAGQGAIFAFEESTK
ncbi:MAG: VOC family protein [Rhizobiaceae bacterium]